MNPNWQLRFGVWVAAIATGGLGWWLASDVVAEVSDLPSLSYVQGFGLQLGIQLIVQSALIAIAALMDVGAED